jgi:hypothetical protein
MDQEIRNKLRNVVTQCRKLLEDAIEQDLEGKYGIFAKKGQVTADPNAKMTHLSEEEQAARKDILDHFRHIQARGFTPKDALDQLVREVAFTHLNRFCAYKMMEAREVHVGGQKFREAVSRGVNSNGVKFYLADHPQDERLFNSGHRDVAYRHFLDWLGGSLSEEIGVLFSPNDPANRLYPQQQVLDEVLDLLNGGGIKDEETDLREQWPLIWSQDETIGWVYQYFTPKELRDQARTGNKPPANSYELAFRNQFFTPRFVVEFLTDNTLGRIWYEMRRAETQLKDQCRYMVRRPSEVFLKEGDRPPEDAAEEDDLSPEGLLKLPILIPHRPKKDPRQLKVLDPACGSGHFLLYCFDLLLTIYEEAYADPDLGPALRKDYPTVDALRRDVPRLILAHNLHGIDIDLRASQIAAFALWLRCQRAYQDMGLKKDRPRITRSNFVCAEPMPGEEQMLNEFVAQLEPKVLGHVVKVVFDKMALAGDTGSLLKIEEELRDSVAAAKKQYIRETTQATDRRSQPLLFTQAAMDRIAAKPDQPSLFDLSDITDSQFFEQAEARVIEALRTYAEKAHGEQKLQKRLFADDAVRGFSFIELSQKPFDVVLMNPPFGAEVPSTRAYITATYPRSKHDLCASFIERHLQLLAPNGSLGAITTRTALFAQTFSNWRSDILDARQFFAVGDLGYGVLDAMVETAMYVITNAPPRTSSRTAFLSALTDINKDGAIVAALTSERVSFRSQESFRHIPGRPMAYWVPNSLLAYFRKYKSFLKRGGLIKVGVQSGDDFRFFRLRWEVPSGDTNTRAPEYDPHFKTTAWLPLAKGGEYSPWWDDLHLVVDWRHEGRGIKEHPSARPQNVDLFFRPGLTYPYRTTSGFGLRALPAGCGFSVGGWGVFPPDGYSAHEVFAVYNTRIARYFMEVLLGQGDSSVAGSAARNHGAEAVGGIPFPPSFCTADLVAKVNRVCDVWRYLATDETCSFFVRPSLCQHDGTTLLGAAMKAWQRKCEMLKEVAALTADLDRLVREAYGIKGDEQRAIAEEEGSHPSDYPTLDTQRKQIHDLLALPTDQLIAFVQERHGSKRYVVKKAYSIDRQVDLVCHVLGLSPQSVVDVLETGDPRQNGVFREWCAELISYVIGCVFGRWDVRCAVGDVSDFVSCDPFAYLPHSAPGGLKAQDGSTVTHSPHGYPQIVAWDGIVVDDSTSDEGIVKKVRDTIEIIWPKHSDGIEKEVCEALEVATLQDYFRKSGKDGFWEDHVARYSKSRRNAPVYWLLQTAKKNYALWLYYHRLDKDLLFKVLVNYVEPKIRLEAGRLESLRAQNAVAGESGKEAKRLAKDVERQEDFLTELRDFEDKLRRAANLHLEPDPNDGVVLNIAPLWELIPWKEAKTYWDELLAGEYEWSSIGKQLREKGLVKK